MLPLLTHVAWAGVSSVSDWFVVGKDDIVFRKLLQEWCHKKIVDVFAGLYRVLYGGSVTIGTMGSQSLHTKLRAFSEPLPPLRQVSEYLGRSHFNQRNGSRLGCRI